MDLHENMIIASGNIITPNIVSCRYNAQTRQYDVVFKSGKQEYHYNAYNILWLKDPSTPDPNWLRIEHNGRELFGIDKIYIFSSRNETYWRICFANGAERDYKGSELTIRKSALCSERAKEVADYLRCAAELCTLKAEDGTKLLTKQYEVITNGKSFVDNDTAFAAYLDPQNFKIARKEEHTLIFPFGCNASQYEAVENAVENQVSVIEGPPGTGKTQTILNIIANLLVMGKTVQVVSNNNSAISNVLEKLEKENLSFIAALLGNSENKRAFINSLEEKYPSFEGWNAQEDSENDFKADIKEIFSQLNEAFQIQNKAAKASRAESDIKTEHLYFKKYLDETGQTVHGKTNVKRDLPSSRLMALLQQCQRELDKKGKIPFWIKLRNCFIYGISDWELYKKDPQIIISVLQDLFYIAKIRELQDEQQEYDRKLKELRADELISNCKDMSMKYLRKVLYNRYAGNEKRQKFNEEDLWKFPGSVQDEYPVVLSTTFSSRSSLGKNAKFDYVIIDEASQVDVATGALALSNAYNAVIVGDGKQLPNVVTDSTAAVAEKLFSVFELPCGYDFAKCSFLKSVCKIIPNAPRTLLKEHYRCHPKIINFCNQKFYGGELVIMTKDSGETDALSAFRTVKGNHARGHFNQRQIDVVISEVLPKLSCPSDEIGIIAPYNDQVNATREQIHDKGITIATVHKFQGREKDAMVMMTVENEISEFTDDPYLLNVAVSRAKKQFCIVTSGNEQPKDGNIKDLIDYIDYQSFAVTDSKIYSVFDYLYSQYTKERIDYLRKHKRISAVDSENLAYGMIKDALTEFGRPEFCVACHVPLRMVLRDLSRLSVEELRYVTKNGTHVDFIIYNRVSQKPIMAIEIDGYRFHKTGTAQYGRDVLKNGLFEKYEIPYVRFATNGSNEKEILLAKLTEIVAGK